MCWYNTTALCTCQVPVHVWSSLVDQSDIRADCEAVPVHWLGTLGAPVVALSLFRVVESRARVVESVLKPTGLKARYFQEVETRGHERFNAGVNLMCSTCELHHRLLTGGFLMWPNSRVRYFIVGTVCMMSSVPKEGTSKECKVKGQSQRQLAGVLSASFVYEP